MTTIDVLKKSYKFNRLRTLALLEQIEKEQASPINALLWRPGPQRAHIGWQLVHIAVTEDIFASERLSQRRPGSAADWWPRFRGGSTPSEERIPPEKIHELLSATRENLLETLGDFSEEQLQEIPEALQERGWRVLDVMHIVSWHEAHHQGQAHITYNLFKAAQGSAH